MYCGKSLNVGFHYNRSVVCTNDTFCKPISNIAVYVIKILKLCMSRFQEQFNQFEPANCEENESVWILFVIIGIFLTSLAGFEPRTPGSGESHSKQRAYTLVCSALGTAPRPA